MYIQRYMQHFPAAGEVVIFDRSRYNRAGVEKVMGFCTKAQHKRDYDIPESDSMLDADVLATLGDLGVQLGRDPGSWKSHVPSPEWPQEFFEDQ